MAEKDAPQIPQDAQFQLQKIYVKDISFETPHTPGIFKTEWKPVVDLHLTNHATKIEESLYDVVLSVTVTVKLGEETAYLVEINQAGVFLLNNLPDDVLDRMLGIACPNILFPYAREAVTDVVLRGGFPQLLLHPVNFEALYEQQKNAPQQPQEKTTH